MKAKTITENGFKETDAGLIPEAWGVKVFTQCIDKIKTPKKIKFYQPEYKKYGKYAIIHQGKELIAGYHDEPERLYQGNTPIIIFGDVSRTFKFIDFPFSLGADGSKIVSPIRDLLDAKYFYFYLKTLNIPSKGYNRHFKDLKEKLIIIPPLPEQQKIAFVLSKIQLTIEQQNKIIQTTKELKKSLMNKLFAEGLHGEEKKETEIGLIPKSWDAVKLGDEGILELVQYGISVRGEPDGKYPILRMNCLINGYVVNEKLQFVNIDKALFHKFQLEQGDILFNRTNSIDLVGKTGIFSLKGEYTFASYLIRLKTNKKKLDPSFLNLYLNLDESQKRLKTLATRGVSQSNISGSRLKTFSIPLPSDLRAQEEISKIVSSIDRKLSQAESRKQTLQALFKTMLNQLMTGQVRVKDLDIEVN
jgi:type I restriction enzyme S subunit